MGVGGSSQKREIEYNKMNVRRKTQVNSHGGQETTRPHTVSTHIREPSLILEHTHPHGSVHTDRHILCTPLL